jgi:hypothetical protein
MTCVISAGIQTTRVIVPMTNDFLRCFFKHTDVVGHWFKGSDGLWRRKITCEECKISYTWVERQ